MADSTTTPIDVPAVNAARDAAAAAGRNPYDGAGATDLSTAAGLGTRAPIAPRVNPDSISPDTSVNGTGTFNQFEEARKLTPDEVKTTADKYAAQLKGQTDAISAAFLDKTNNQKDTNSSNEARVRVLNTGKGLVDSGTGSAALARESDKGNKALGAIDDQRTLALTTAIDKIDALKENALKSEQVNKNGDVTAYNNLQTQNKKDATDVLTSLAKTGVNILDLQSDKKNPNDPNELSSFDHLAKTLNLSPLELTSKYNALKDAAHQVKFTYKVAGDQVIAYGVDPVTGKLVEQTQTVPGLADGNWSITSTKDGTLLKFNKNTGEYKVLHGGTGGASSGKGVTDGPLKVSAEELGTVRGYLDNGVTINGQTYNPRGADGWVDPNLYKALYDNWTKKGGSAAGFTKQFPPKDYVNPAAKSLPAYLQNKTKATKATSGA